MEENKYIRKCKNVLCSGEFTTWMIKQVYCTKRCEAIDKNRSKNG